MDLTRHNADFACARGNHTRTVGPDQTGSPPFHEPSYLHHIENWNSFGNANNQIEIRIDSFHDGVGGERRRNKNKTDVTSSSGLGFVHGVKYRKTKMFRAAFAGRNTTHHFGSI